MNVPEIIGVTGTVLIVGSYLLLQLSLMRETQMRFHAINTIGALMILYSLFFAFNLGAAFIEVFWVIVSLYGIYRCLKVNPS